MKYIRFEDGEFIIWDEFLCTHAEMAQKFSQHIVVSAGFITLKAGIVYGRSVSLGLSSDPRDSVVFEQH